MLHVFPTFALGGAQRRFLQIAEGVPGWSHDIVSLDGDTAAASRLPMNATLAEPGLTLGKSAGLSPRNLWRVHKYLAARQPDLLCTYNWGSIEVALANRLTARRPHIHFEDGFGPEEAGGTLPRRDLFRRAALGGNTHVVVPSSALAELGRRAWRIPEARLHHMVNGVDTARFSPATQQERTSPVIGFVGALRAEKNVPRLIQAIADAAENIEVMIVGEGPTRGDVEAMSARMDVSPRFVGSMDDPSAAYAGMDIFALTSDTEQMPLTVLEAMAAGLPIVATDVGDIAKMVAPENRPFIVPLERAAAALPAAIDALCHDAPRRRAIGVANRQRALELFSQTQMFTAYGELLDQVAKAKQRKSAT